MKIIARSKSLITFFVVLMLIVLVSCSKKVRFALPGEYADSANIVGVDKVWDWGDEKSEYFQRDFIESIKQFRSSYPELFTNHDATIDILAISGGGSKGAFGIGLLKGWQDAGGYPHFRLVTGISTGALIAPFAFLGGKHLDTAAELYLTSTDKDIYIRKPFTKIIFSLFGSDSVSSSRPLQSLIKKHITKEFLKEVADQYRKGRRLYIGTTNLDAKRLVIWNMGHIAEIGTDRALELFQKVMLASASIPVALPPVYFSVEVNGHKYDEMHVDGGATVEVFFYGSILDLNDARRSLNIEFNQRVRLFIIRNSIIEPRYKAVKPRIIDIASNALSHLLGSQGIGDLYKIYTISNRDGFEYYLASIPGDYDYVAKSAFDNVEMNKLYKLGYDAARNGYQWKRFPPGYKE